MTDEELEAVCRRHGIETISAKNDVVTSGFLARYTEEFGRLGVGETPVDAVCALLKARWGITTRDGASAPETWYAQSYDGMPFAQCQYADTELAAVVALADRLRESGS